MPSAPLERVNAPVTTGWSFATVEEMFDGYKAAIASGLTAQLQYVPVDITVTATEQVVQEDGTTVPVPSDRQERIWTHRLVINTPGVNDEDVVVHVDNPGNDGALRTKLVMENGQFKAYTDDEFDALFQVKA